MFPLWDGPCTGPWRQCLTFCALFISFSIFFCYFLAIFECITIFGTGPWTLTTLPNMITSNEHHPPFFLIFLLFSSYSWMYYHIWTHTLNPENNPWCHHQQWAQPLFFSDFLAIFWLFSAILPYLDMHPGPWKQPLMLSPTVSTTPIFFWFFGYFVAIFSYVTIFGNAPWTLKTTSNIIPNSEHHP